MVDEVIEKLYINKCIIADFISMNQGLYFQSNCMASSVEGGGFQRPPPPVRKRRPRINKSKVSTYFDERLHQCITYKLTGFPILINDEHLHHQQCRVNMSYYLKGNIVDFN